MTEQCLRRLKVRESLYSIYVCIYYTVYLSVLNLETTTAKMKLYRSTETRVCLVGRSKDESVSEDMLKQRMSLQLTYKNTAMRSLRSYFWVNTSITFTCISMHSETLERWCRRLLAECQWAAVQKEQLCVGKAEVWASRGECVPSAEQSLAAHVHHWTASSIFFLSSSLSQTHSCAETFKSIRLLLQMVATHMWVKTKTLLETFHILASPSLMQKFDLPLSNSILDPYRPVKGDRLNPSWGYLDCGKKQKYSEKGHKKRLAGNNSLSCYDAFTSCEQTVIFAPSSPCC